jgi:hypothetical protein
MKGRRAPALVFGILLLIKTVVFLLAPYPATGLPNSDGYDYVGRARAFLVAGALPSSTAGDHRPPGYFWVLAVLLKVASTDHGISVLTRLVNLALQACVSVAAFAILCRLRDRMVHRLAAALLVGAEPWTFTYVRLIVPEPTVTFLVVFGNVLLGVSTTSGDARRRILFLAAGSALLSAAFLFRGEMIVLAALVTGAAVLWMSCSRRELLHLGLVAVTPFLVVCSLNLGYRLSVDGRPRLFGTLTSPHPGLFRWASTWVGSSRIKLLAAVGWRKGSLSLHDLPDSAFEDEAEKRTVLAVFERTIRSRSLSREDDATLMRVAEERIRAHPWRCVVLTRFDNLRLFWMSLDDLYHNSGFFSRFGPPVGVSLALAAFLARCAVLALAALGGCHSLWRLRERPEDSAGSFLALGAILVLVRVVSLAAIGVILEPRYLTPAWPFLICLAGFGFSTLLEGASPGPGLAVSRLPSR